MEAVSLIWVGGEHRFALRLGNLRAVQQHCNAGPEEVYNRLSDGRWRVDDLFEVLRQGLIGGGMAESEASRLITETIGRHPLLEFVITARAVLASSLVGSGEEDPGEATGVAESPEN